MKVLLTGTHFTPAQAVIEEFNKLPDVSVVYVGRKYTQEGDKAPSVESQLLPKFGVKFIPIIAGRLRRIPDFRTILSFFKIPVGFIQSPVILLKEKPDIILSFGGYVSVPIVIWGWLFSIPIMVHEQTLVSGLANTISNFFADKIAVSFDKNYPFPKEKSVVTGNPIRNELLKENFESSENLKAVLRLKQKEKLRLIYLTGGNQGSLILNNALEPNLDEIMETSIVVHQTGDSKENHYEKFLEKGKNSKTPERYLVQKWFNVQDVASILREADLVISRAGINTLLELSFFQVPTIVIPLPFLYKNEQMVNAKFFENLGLCQIIEQKILTPKKLLTIIKETFKNYSNFKEGAKKSKAVVIPDGARRIVQEVLILNHNATT